MEFAIKKNTNKIKNIKKKKKVSEIKINISNNALVKGKTFTKVFKFTSIEKLCEMLNDINPDIRLKLLINYAKDEFLIFKTEYVKKKKKFKDSENDVKNENELNNEEIAALLKSFYSNEQFKWDDLFLKKNDKLKYEIAPTSFEVKENYLISDNKFISTITLEHLGSHLNIKKIMEYKDYWLIIDCYKVNSDYILDKLNEMKEDKAIEKKFNPFISNKINDVVNKLKSETIFQCDIKFLIYNSNLEQIKEENRVFRENLLKSKYTSYMSQEIANTRKLFEKCIYPNMSMDIIHSISNEYLYSMIGADGNV